MQYPAIRLLIAWIFVSLRQLQCARTQHGIFFSETVSGEDTIIHSSNLCFLLLLIGNLVSRQPVLSRQHVLSRTCAFSGEHNIVSGVGLYNFRLMLLGNLCFLLQTTQFSCSIIQLIQLVLPQRISYNSATAIYNASESQQSDSHSQPNNLLRANSPLFFV